MSMPLTTRPMMFVPSKVSPVGPYSSLGSSLTPMRPACFLAWLVTPRVPASTVSLDEFAAEFLVALEHDHTQVAVGEVDLQLAHGPVEHSGDAAEVLDRAGCLVLEELHLDDLILGHDLDFDAFLLDHVEGLLGFLIDDDVPFAFHFDLDALLLGEFFRLLEAEADEVEAFRHGLDEDLVAFDGDVDYLHPGRDLADHVVAVDGGSGFSVNVYVTLVGAGVPDGDGSPVPHPGLLVGQVVERSGLERVVRVALEPDLKPAVVHLDRVEEVFGGHGGSVVQFYHDARVEVVTFLELVVRAHPVDDLAGDPLHEGARVDDLVARVEFVQELPARGHLARHVRAHVFHGHPPLGEQDVSVRGVVGREDDYHGVGRDLDSSSYLVVQVGHVHGTDAYLVEGDPGDARSFEPLAHLREPLVLDGHGDLELPIVALEHDPEPIGLLHGLLLALEHGDDDVLGDLLARDLEGVPDLGALGDLYLLAVDEDLQPLAPPRGERIPSFFRSKTVADLPPMDISTLPVSLTRPTTAPTRPARSTVPITRSAESSSSTA